ncbi:MAG: extracellular solute-binding protein [Phycisphaerae bacterium]|nr:extracellular solute-binding protein [Phycisphaerae bacterium]
MSFRHGRRYLAALIFAAGIVGPAGRAAMAGEPVTIYCSADEAFARPLLAEFTRRTGIAVRPLFDTEAGKTTGLVTRLLAERDRPRADVWWSSEIFGTLQLARASVLTPYDSPASRDLPPSMRGPQREWTAFGMRGRVIAYDPKRTPRERLPRRWVHLAQPDFKDRFAMANPVFGTTRGHMAALAALWGDDAFRRYVEGLRVNGVRIADGNAQAVLLVARGDVELCATDTDDVLVAQARGDRIAMHFPNLHAPDGSPHPGTLWIPNSVALVAGGPNPDGGKRLIDFLVSAEVEMKLAMSDSANVPVRLTLQKQLSLAGRPKKPDAGASVQDVLEAFRGSAMIDYAAAAEKLQSTDALVKSILIR